MYFQKKQGVIFIILLFLSGCNLFFQNNKIKEMKSCKTNIDRFLNKKLAAWSGLTEGCSKSDIIASWSFNEGEGHLLLGKDYRPVAFKTMKHPNYADLLFFYFEGDSLIQIVANYPDFDIETQQKILRSLGEPDVKLDFYFHISVIPEAEWLYTKKGIALSFNADHSKIVRIAVFKRLTKELYHSHFYQTELDREPYKE